MGVKFIVKAAVREYTDKNGDVKKFYNTIGTVFETKHGLMLSLESLPLFALKEGKLVAYLNEPEEKEYKPKQEAKDPFADTPF